MPHRMHPLLSSALALILVLTAVSAPVVAEPAGPEAISVPSCVRVTGVTLDGPVAGEVGQSAVFVATAQPADAGVPIAFSWNVTDFGRFTNSSGLSDIQEFPWNTPGLKTVSVQVRNCGDTLPGPTDSQQIQIGPLALTAVPDDVRQRAALHLAEQQISGQFPEWQYAHLAEYARPLYRPDLVDPAYYEFTVLAPPQEQQEASASAVMQDVPAGFIVVSTGEHDYPIPHWATSGDAPTERMRSKALLSQLPAPVRFYRLDALSYVGEDSAGDLVATEGNLPHRVTGIPDEWLSAPPLVETTAQPGAMFPTEPTAPVTFTVTTINEPPTNPVVFEGWDSWGALKTDYAAAYAPFLQAMERSAALEWEVERHAGEYGHVLYLGESLSFPLLGPDPVPMYAGPAWDDGLVTADVHVPEGGTPRLVIEAVDHVPGQSVRMQTDIAYSNGMTDTLKVMVVYRSYVYLPLVTRGSTEGATPSGAGDAGLASARSDAATSNAEAQAGVAGTLAADGYTYWYASSATAGGAGAQQVWYGQYTAEDLIGNCRSGCGPTAWAMLIAWGDRQAAYQTLPDASPIWAGRWGLYRVLGGYGSDAIAPEFMGDAAQAQGVKNMTFDLNHQVGTFCNAFNDNGATVPATMGGVVGYLNGRSGMQVKTWYNPAGFDLAGATAQSIGEKARNVIQNPLASRRPSIIGIGLLSHYPLAFGYREKPIERCTTQCVYVPGGSFFGTCTTTCSRVGTARGWYVNQGNAVPGKYGTMEWIASDLWFAGRLTPHTSYVDDVGLYRASNSYFYLDYSRDAVNDRNMAPFGWPTGIRPVVGDFNRDGMLDDLAVYVWSHSDPAYRRQWHIDYNMDRSTDVYRLQAWSSVDNTFPMAVDVDRDGYVDDLGLYQPAARSWVWNRNAETRSAPSGDCSYATVPNFPTDGLPVTGDFNNDGYHDDVAIFSRSNGLWYFDYRITGCGIDVTKGPWGTGSDLPVSGDFDKDGFADDLGLYSGIEGGNRRWYYNYNAAKTGLTWDYITPAPYGGFGDMPFSGNFDTN